MSQEYDYITLYLPNGATLQFHMVTATLDLDSDVLIFSYVSKSTGKMSTARFTRSKLAGISWTHKT